MQRAILERSDFGERVHQTTHFDLSDEKALRNTWADSAKFLDRARSKASEVQDLGSSVVFLDVPEDVVSDYLLHYSFHPNETWRDAGLTDYIGAEVEAGMRWNVAVMGSTTEQFPPVKLGERISLRPWNRSRFDGPPREADIGVLRNAGSDEIIDLTLNPKAPNERSRDRFRRRVDDPRFSRHALLVLYPIAKGSTWDEKRRRNERKKRVDLRSGEDLIGLMLVFPKARNPGSGVFYKLDPTLLEEEESVEDVDVDSDVDDVA